MSENSKAAGGVVLGALLGALGGTLAVMPPQPEPMSDVPAACREVQPGVVACPAPPGVRFPDAGG